MNNGEYWQKRFELLEQAAHQQGVQCYADIEKQYRQAQKQLEGQIAAWYQRFASNNGVTLAEAKRMLNAKELAELKWDVNQYIQYGQENAINGTWVKQLENASARFHISRLEALKLQTQQSIEVMFGNQLDSIDSTMRNVYKSGYYHTAYEIQKGVGVGWDFSALDDKQISKVINKPWAVDGKNFSERIWDNRQKLVNELNNTLTQNIILGKDPQKAIDEIARKMNTSKTNAGRLVMTEEAFFSSAAQKDCFDELDVEQFEIVATLDSHTSDICRGMDGKHFPMSEWKVGVTAPPFHVHCRSTTVPYFDDEFDAVGERAARDEETGKTYFVPGNMTYKEWEKAFVKGDKSRLQERLSDEKIDEKIKELKQKQSDLSAWGDYDTVVKDWGSVDDYFDEDDAESLTAKNQFLKYQEEIESLIKQRSSDLPVQIGGVTCSVTHEQFSFSDGSGRTTTPKNAVVYKTPDNTKFVFPEQYDKSKQTMTPDKAVELWYKVPESIRIKAQKTIEFVDYYNPQDSYWKKKYKNFTHSYATGGDTITFYRYDRLHNDDYVIRTYCHESGHYIDKSLSVNGIRYAESSEWTKAMTDDKMVSGSKSVTTYGENSNVEDFAESVAEYIRDNSTFIKKFPNRAKLIEQILK